MAPRRLTAARRGALVDELRQACREGELRPGDPLPTMRELQEKYDLSPRTVTLALRKLVAEGLLRTEPRVGTFVADPSGASDQVYLVVTPSVDMASAAPQVDRMRIGFEDEIARLGGVSLCLDANLVGGRVLRSLPEIGGIFAASFDPEVDVVLDEALDVPRVRLSPHAPDESPVKFIVDTVSIDHVDGGRRATRHLVQHGHRRIAFLGLHAADNGDPLYRWSALRRQGWSEVMDALGEPTDEMVFLPAKSPGGYRNDAVVAADVAQTIVQRRDITAVVSANDHAALGLVAAMRDAGVPARSWPSLVGFDGAPDVKNLVFTTLRLPWEGIGTAAAQMLWDRWHDKLSGPATHRSLPMTLVPRIGARQDWSRRIEPDTLVDQLYQQAIRSQT